MCVLNLTVWGGEETQEVTSAQLSPCADEKRETQKQRDEMREAVVRKRTGIDGWSHDELQVMGLES